MRQLVAWHDLNNTAQHKIMLWLKFLRKYTALLHSRSLMNALALRALVCCAILEPIQYKLQPNIKVGEALNFPLRRAVTL